ncbi:hypothetical protein [Oligoflexus tunisiensis]|uniref:hypothetical protein n=1 Tax=Oligoflexus tunisiensis TaxID=708132 RepID=UPI00114CB742|nr:hypothetical protein [Oligoflexus tunisiensis]
MKSLRSVLLLSLGFSMQHCTDVPPSERHQTRAQECLPPGDPAYDMNLGEPKCPNPPLTDPN